MTESYRASGSIRQSYGLVSRSTSHHYHPNQAQCTGAGTTCQEAVSLSILFLNSSFITSSKKYIVLTGLKCGGGSTQCDSTDTNQLYCYDPTAGATCCPDGRGNSCAAGYYCYPEELSQTLCCANGTTTSECLDKFVAAQSAAAGAALPTATSSITVDGITTPLFGNGTNSTIVASNSTAKANSTASPTSISACGHLTVELLRLLGITALTISAVTTNSGQLFANSE